MPDHTQDPEIIAQLRSLVDTNALDDDARAEVSRALEELSVKLRTHAEQDADLKDSHRRAAIERAFFSRAAREQLMAPEDALALLGDLDLAVNDAGKVEGIDEVFSELRSSRPYLFARSSTPGVDQITTPAADPSNELLDRVQRSGLTRDIQLWREARSK